jgi:hypothetical protein
MRDIPMYTHGHLDGDQSKVYELDTRYADDPVCTFVLVRGPRYRGDPGDRMYTRSADIGRFEPIGVSPT